MPLLLCPSLGHDNTCFNGLAKADFIRQQNAARQGGAKGKQGRVHLMRIEIHARSQEGGCQ